MQDDDFGELAVVGALNRRTPLDSERDRAVDDDDDDDDDAPPTLGNRMRSQMRSQLSVTNTKPF